MKENESKLELKIKFLDSKRNSLFFLSIICLIAVIIRLYHTPFDTPVILDSIFYFLHAYDISITGQLTNYNLSHSGWSEFLSLFFMIFHFDNAIDYMNLQRIVSVILSGMTVIPVYFICKKYFNNYYSLVGAIIFAFEPRIIINSTLGITDTLYIFAITLGILFFLNSNKKIMLLSFGIIAWATIIRSEGQFWFVCFTILYFLRFRKSRKDLMMYVIVLAIFLLVLSPIVIHRIQCCETDGIFARILGELSMYDDKREVIEDVNDLRGGVYGPNWIDGIKLFGWSMIPIFVIFVPIGLILIFKQLKYPNYVLVLVLTILSIPILYSVSVGPDTRYVYPIFSIFCVISLFGIKWICDHYDNKRIILAIVTIAIISSSIVFLQIKTNDLEYYKEYNVVAQYVINNTTGINGYYPEDGLVRGWEIIEQWPNLKYSSPYNFAIINNVEVNSLKDFIIDEKHNGLTHLVIDENKNRAPFIKDVYSNEHNYPYLMKVFDTKDLGYKHGVKIFKIDYSIINK